MNIFDRIFRKKKSKEVIDAHEVIEEKSNEAQILLKQVSKKMEQVANDIEMERLRTNEEMSNKIKRIRDVATQIAYITGGVS